MASLYEIDSNIQAIIDSIYEASEDGEVNEVDFTALEELQAERKVKLENIALYIKNCDAEAAAIQAEINTLKSRMERLERKSEGLRGILLNSMIANGDKELSSPRFVAKIRTSKATEIIDESLIPDEFIRVITKEPERKPDKAAIKKAIEAGQEIAGAKVVINNKVNIQ